MDACPEDSLQTLELLAVVWACVTFTGPLNVVTDSLYVAGVAERLEDASIKEVTNRRLYELLLQLQRGLQIRENPYCIIHIRSHKWDIGLGEGNARADQLVMTVDGQGNNFEIAREMHDLYHQNAKGLMRSCTITAQEAKAIVRACPICSYQNSGVGLGCGVNPCGLKRNEIWQMDVTHVSEFGRLKYVHVTVDTYSKYMWATAQAGERALHVIRHLTSCFAVMGVPSQIKTDNGPAYVGKRVEQFLRLWKVKHVTGIPHSPTGQAIVERANHTLKAYLKKHDGIADPQERLAKVLYVLNHLCVFGDEKVPPAVRHEQQQDQELKSGKKVWVQYRDPKTGLWEGPAEVIYWGRGYVCVSTPTGTLWVPAKWIKPYVSGTENGGET